MHRKVNNPGVRAGAIRKKTTDEDTLFSQLRVSCEARNHQASAQETTTDLAPIHYIRKLTVHIGASQPVFSACV